MLNTKSTHSSRTNKRSSKVSALHPSSAEPPSSPATRSLDQSRECRPDVSAHNRSTSDGLNSTAGNLDDFSRAYVSLVRYLKAIWPSREGKKLGRRRRDGVDGSSNGSSGGSGTPAKKKRSGDQRSARALELQLKRQQERILWHREGQAGWRTHRVIDPSAPIDSLDQLDLNHHHHGVGSTGFILSPNTTLGSPHPRSFQAAKPLAQKIEV